MVKEGKHKNKVMDIYEDIKIPTQCHRCMAECGIIARRVNGVVVKLEGNPRSSVGSRGGLCPKGLAGIQLLYDPNRLNYPMRRTNFKKGIGVDPHWKRISWDEALSEIALKLKTAMDKDPSRIMLQTGIVASNMLVPNFIAKMMMVLSTEKGSPVPVISGGAHCGNAGHLVNAMNYAAFVIQPDWKHCNYVLQWGTNFGHGNFMQYVNKLVAEAQERGMKLVVFDPICNYAAAKATEWVPLLPGTDAAVALAMLNVIVNELGVYDAEYLKYKSNAPYLIGEDRRYIREKNSGKPMVWDLVDNKAKAFDDGVKDYALEGEFSIYGVKCQPAWQLLREHFKQYPVEKASSISGVPANTIRRIATEYARSAMVGATIQIDGKKLPYRPVGVQHIRAAVTHQNAAQTCYAIDLLAHVVGAANVPGGVLSVSVECHGYPGTGMPYLGVAADSDGLVTVGGKWLFKEKKMWPVPEPRKPIHKDLGDLFTAALEVPIWAANDRDELLQKAGLNAEFDILLNYASNSIMNAANPRDKESFFKTIPFIVDVDIFPTEFNEGFADILLPDTSYLEYTDWAGIQHPYHNQPPTLEDPWCFHITQKVIEPMYERRHAPQVFDEIIERMGLRHKLNVFYNEFLELKEQFKLKSDERIEWEDLCDRIARQHFGDEHNWEWFKKNGFISFPKKVEEVYWKPFKSARVQVYWEFLESLGEKLQSICRPLGIELDWQQFTALPNWFPCAPHKIDDSQFDLYCFCYRDPVHQNSCTMEQPWLDEVSNMNPYTYNITMNTKTAGEKGLSPGDIIEIESSRGHRVRGTLEVRQGQHPKTVAIMGTAGHWALGQPVARGKGVHFNSLMETHYHECDPISFNQEVMVKVRVNKVATKLDNKLTT